MHAKRVSRASKAVPPPAPAGAGGAHEFYAAATIDELAAAQGVTPLKDPSILAGVWPEDEDLDQFIAETYQSRRA
jgi:hypothetical protein